MEERLPLRRAGVPCGELLRREEGLHAVFTARVPDGTGVQKLWLCGVGGEPLLLGTLMPLGGGWRLERRLSVRALREHGLTGALCGEITPGPPPEGEDRPPGERPPAVGDTVLAPLLAGARGEWRREGGCWRLTLPWRRDGAFPLAPAFCLARLEGEAVCYYFSAAGEILPPPV